MLPFTTPSSYLESSLKYYAVMRRQNGNWDGLVGTFSMASSKTRVEGFNFFCKRPLLRIKLHCKTCPYWRIQNLECESKIPLNQGSPFPGASLPLFVAVSEILRPPVVYVEKSDHP
jgi:hypothetical protein